MALRRMNHGAQNFVIEIPVYRLLENVVSVQSSLRHGNYHYISTVYTLNILAPSDFCS